MDFLDEELDEILNIFQQESGEILQSMDKSLFALEKDPNNHEIVMQLAREAHSLKGSARMLGFNSIQEVAHKVEDVLGLIKDHKLIPNSFITDSLSESLSHVSMLINKTVESKKEFISTDTQSYVEKLIKIASNNEFQAPKQDFYNCPQEVRKLLSKLNKIEELLIHIIYIFSNARQNGDFSHIQILKKPLGELNVIIHELKMEEFSKLINEAATFLNSIQGEIQELEILALNAKIDGIEEYFTNYCAQNKIETQNYFDIANELLVKNSQENSDKNEEINAIAELIDRIYEKLSLLEINLEFLPDVKELIAQILTKVKNSQIKKIFEIQLKILNFYENNSKNLEHDTLYALKEVNEGARKIFDSENTDDKDSSIELLVQKINIVEQMTKINLSKPQAKKEVVKSEKSPDWMNSIDTSDIKTLRIDSFKLDKLVNQIGDLIISRIKTNEQLNVAKTLQNDLLEWQKSFNKMNYYIKYFDKKYAANSSLGMPIDPRTIISYNKQLLLLQNMHSEKLNSFIKEMNDLFKQMQENDSKLNSTTNEIEGMVKNMRVLPFSTIFHLFPRMVHNIAKDKGKQIEFIIEGADVSVDKKIIEEIKIPLIHILRNSIDHGIEDPNERKRLGKNPVGKILISAKHLENKIVINIKDDGQGLDIEKIKQKALERGLLTQEEINNIDEEQLINIIFYPGFTTGETVTELSGRGLGLDIVSTKISQLNGRVDIYSQFQKGTTVTISLPATMATLKAFIVLEQEQLYAVPTSSIQTVLRVDTSEVFERDNKNYFLYNDEVIPVLTLSQILELENKPRLANKYTLMIVKSENSIVGVIVEKLISDQEILHKKLEAPLFKVKNISGITTLANGEICLILNIGDIFSAVAPKKIATKIVASNKSIQMQKNYEHKILVVDDSLTTRTLQKNILKSFGYQVQIATNAPDALVDLQKEKFDLIVTDHEMPQMTGLEFVKHIKADKELMNIPIIVLTSISKQVLGASYDNLGVNAYIQKSEFKQEDFIKIVGNLLN